MCHGPLCAVLFAASLALAGTMLIACAYEFRFGFSNAFVRTRRLLGLRSATESSEFLRARIEFGAVYQTKTLIDEVSSMTDPNVPMVRTLSLLLDELRLGMRYDAKNWVITDEKPMSLRERGLMCVISLVGLLHWAWAREHAKRCRVQLRLRRVGEYTADLAEEKLWDAYFCDWDERATFRPPPVPHLP